MRYLIPTLGLAVLLLLPPLPAAAQEAPLEEDSKVFMQAKLKHSQAILAALVTEDFDGIAKGAQELSLLSRASQWKVLQTPEYVTRSNEFRREVDALTNAAKKKNLEGATLAYVKVTMNCVECHKYVRGIRQASLERFPLEAIVSRESLIVQPVPQPK